MKEYIEKDTALETTYEPFTMSMCMTVSECNGMNRAREIIFKQLRDIPAADVRPVVTGRWIKVPALAPFEQDDFRCSECDSWPWWCGVTEENLPNYCPYCGADMREES